MNGRADVEFVDLDFLGHPGVIGAGVLRTRGGAWLIDPGPSSALGALEKALVERGLSLADVRGLALTHIHLDHAGATGTILRRRPDVPVYVHERGAPHLIDPTRLLESAGRLYGGSLERLWGEVVPVPAGNVRMLKGGEHLDLDGRPVEVLYTPGHASHHVAYLDVGTGSAFVGDTGGVRLAPAPHLVAPTPPPDIDLSAWSSSISRIGEWRPSRLYVTHFGPVDEPEAHLERLERQLTASADLARQLLEAPGGDDERMSRFAERMAAELRRVMPEEEARRYQLAIPFEHCWLGLARYWRKRGA